MYESLDPLYSGESFGKGLAQNAIECSWVVVTFLKVMGWGRFPRSLLWRNKNNGSASTFDKVGSCQSDEGCSSVGTGYVRIGSEWFPT
jgi:hypothetical protein